LAVATGPHGRVVATDVDAEALRLLAARVARAAAMIPPDGHAAPIEVRPVGAEDPGLEPGGYDLILLAQVDQYLADRTEYFRRLKIALAAGGRIAVSNRSPYRRMVFDAATAAGLQAREISIDLPAQFLMILESPP
jgi:hypothetical protein